MRTAMPAVNNELWASAPSSPLEKPAGASFPPDPDEVPGTVFLVSSAGNVLKLPIPSQSPRDPLNWPWPKRIACLVAMVVATSVNFFEVKLSSIMFISYQLDFAAQGISDSTIDYVNTFAFVMTAVGFPFGVVLSTAVGRRPVLLASALINTIVTAMAGFLTGFVVFFVSIGGQGLTAGMILGMGLLVVVDATYISERPWAAAALWCAVSILIHVYYLPISFQTGGGVHWRPVYQMWVVPCFFSFLLLVALVPETFFVRPPVAFDGRLLVQSSSERTVIYDSKDNIDSIAPSDEINLEPSNVLDRYFGRLNVRRARGTSWRAAGSIWVQMVLCLGNPLLIWSSLLGGVVLAVAIFQNKTQFQYIIYNLLTAEPLQVQLRRSDIHFAISGIVSALLSIPLSAPLITWFVRFCARRSGGKRHAEVYLIGYVVPIVASAISIGLFAASITNRWPIGVQYIIYGITNISYVLVISAGIVWLTEAFPIWVAASVAIQLFFVIMIGSFLGARLATWAATGNIVGPSILQVILVLVLGAVIVPIAFWGKNVRQYIHGKWSLSQKGALRPQ